MDGKSTILDESLVPGRPTDSMWRTVILSKVVNAAGVAGMVTATFTAASTGTAQKSGIFLQGIPALPEGEENAERPWSVNLSSEEVQALLEAMDEWQSLHPGTFPRLP